MRWTDVWKMPTNCNEVFLKSMKIYFLPLQAHAVATAFPKCFACEYTMALLQLFIHPTPEREANSFPILYMHQVFPLLWQWKMYYEATNSENSKVKSFLIPPLDEIFYLLPSYIICSQLQNCVQIYSKNFWNKIIAGYIVALHASTRSILTVFNANYLGQKIGRGGLKYYWAQDCNKHSFPKLFHFQISPSDSVSIPKLLRKCSCVSLIWWEYLASTAV